MQLKQIIILGIALGFISCGKDNSPTKPPDPVLPDTTSHEFTWEILTFGGNAGSSSLADVAIIDENNIWAVGQIYLQDSTGQFTAYNAVHWNGNEWQLIRIPVKIWNTNSFVTGPLQAIYASNSNDIFVTTGGEIIRYDGQQWGNWEFLFDNLQDTTFGGVNKFWGTSISNLWSVGDKGNIFFYNGETWQKIDSGTTQDINDIWGGKDPNTGKYTILAVASNIFTSYEKEILLIKETTVSKISTDGMDWPADALWFDPGRIYYAVGAGIYTRNNLTGNESWGGPKLSLTQYTSHGIRGNHLNDVFIVGAFGDVLHYNGKSWQSYRETTGLPSGSYMSVAIKGDCVVAVGQDSQKAAILLGRR